MDYKKVYDQLISNRKTLGKPEGYVEVHHIIPKSFGGLDNLENLIALTGREHFIAHRLLAKIYPKTGMVHAIFKMACTGRNTKYKVTARVYEHLRKEHSKRVSENIEANKKKGRPGRVQSEEHKKKRVESRKKNSAWHTQETLDKISKSLTGLVYNRKKGNERTDAERNGHIRAVQTRKENGSYVRTAAVIEKWRAKQLGKPGKPCSEKRKEELKAIKKQTIQCPHCNKEGQCMVMYRWHFDNCKTLKNI